MKIKPLSSFNPLVDILRDHCTSVTSVPKTRSTARRNRSLHKVNEDSEYRATPYLGRAVACAEVSLRQCSIYGLLVLTGLMCVSVAYAEKADRDKPTLVDSDQLNYDDLKQQSIFTGNVVLTKGTLIIRADRLELSQDPEGYQYGVAIATPNKRVFVRQKREAVDEYIEGESERTEYDGKAEIIHFINRAQVRRLVCEKAADEVRGERITFDQRSETYSASGGPLSATPNNRVRTVIQPKQVTAQVTAGNTAQGGAAALMPCVHTEPVTPSSPREKTVGIPLQASPGVLERKP